MGPSNQLMHGQGNRAKGRRGEGRGEGGRMGRGGGEKGKEKGERPEGRRKES